MPASSGTGVRGLVNHDFFQGQSVPVFHGDLPLGDAVAQHLFHSLGHRCTGLAGPQDDNTLETVEVVGLSRDREFVPSPVHGPHNRLVGIDGFQSRVKNLPQLLLCLTSLHDGLPWNFPNQPLLFLIGT